MRTATSPASLRAGTLLAHGIWGLQGALQIVATSMPWTSGTTRAALREGRPAPWVPTSTLGAVAPSRRSGTLRPGICALGSGKRVPSRRTWRGTGLRQRRGAPPTPTSAWLRKGALHSTSATCASSWTSRSVATSATRPSRRSVQWRPVACRAQSSWPSTTRSCKRLIGPSNRWMSTSGVFQDRHPLQDRRPLQDRSQS